MADASDSVARVACTRIPVIDRRLDAALANTRLASFALRAGVAIVTSRAVCAEGAGAGTRRRITGASEVALIAGATNHGVGSRTHACLAAVCLRARISVAAPGAVRLIRVGASTCGCVASAGHVTLIACAANDGARSRAGASHAAVRLGTRIAVVTSHAVRLVGTRASTGRRIASPRAVTLVARRTNDRVRSAAGSGLARV